MHSTLETMLSRGPVLLDGAWGTQLQLRGLPIGACPDTWNLSHPDRVEEVPCAYADAGSQVVLTNTFRANTIALGEAGLADQVEAINRAGVAISKRGAGDRARVFASIGPSGKMFFSGEVTEEALLAAFGAQARTLADAGADGLVIETMGDLEEAKVALAAAKATGLPVAVSMVFDTGKKHDRTITGATPEQCAEALTEAGADVIGANCGLGAEGYIDITRRLRAATDRPLWIKPNAGLPEIVDGQAVYRTRPDEFAAHAAALVDAGASLVGACCGSTPDFIAALARRLGGSH